MPELFARREILQVLVHLAFFIGDEAGASQVVRVVVVLLFFVDGVAAALAAVLPLLLCQLRGDALAADEEVLAGDFALADDVVRVDVERLALRRALEGPLAGGIVDVVARLSVVADGRYAVLLIPLDDAVGVVLYIGPAGLVAVCVIGEHTLADPDRRMRMLTAVAVISVVRRLLLLDPLVPFVRQALVQLVLRHDVADGVVGNGSYYFRCCMLHDDYRDSIRYSTPEISRYRAFSDR